MGLIASVAYGVAAIGGAVVVRLITDDVKEWAPRLADRLTDVAVGRLPERYRVRLGEEWRPHVTDVPGAIGKIVASAGFCWAASTLRITDVRRRRRIEGCARILDQSERLIFDRHFPKAPAEGRELMIDVYKRRLQQRLGFSNVTPANVLDYAEDVARGLKADVQRYFPLIASVLAELADGTGTTGSRR
jgi:hypothetical protein